MRTDAQFLNDILSAIATIRTYIAGKELSDVRNNEMLQSATLYQITVIGEASSRLTRGLCSRHPEVPWHGVRGMRNRVVHDYFGLNPELVWKTVTTELEPLEAQIRAILEQEFPSPDRSSAP